jgi:SAM-dependent methyltransferase
MQPSSIAAGQYLGTTDKLAVRIAIYAYSTNPQSWFSWLGERLSVKGDVLEVGAGTGELWKEVDYSEAKLTLTDFSPAMCASLQKLSIPGSSVQQCDAAALPFPDRSFDYVIANHMLHHVDDPDVVLQEFARVLRPGGRLFVSLIGSKLNELNALAASIGRPARVLNSTRITADNGAEYLARYFTDVKTELYPGDLHVPTPEPVLAYLGSLGEEPLTSTQTLTARNYIESRIAAEGSFIVHKQVALFTARRS